MSGNQKNAAISDRILNLIADGKSVPESIDSVLGEGTYKRLADDLWEAFNRK
jgi:hypothetical protein